MTPAQLLDVYTAIVGAALPYAVVIDGGIAILAVVGIAWRCIR